ncbi:MAG: CoA pyrophosphatase [Clostridiales bacterium]|nr:CoA pyrophosphatase [Clostridiales bacterium]
MDELERIKGVLPEIPGINGRDELINSAVMLLLVMVDGEYHMLFEKRSQHVRQAGDICFPGGRVEKPKDRDSLMAAVRETSEELGIPEESIRILGRLDTVVAIMGQIIDVFVGVTDVSPERMNIDEKEVEKIFTIPVSHFRSTTPEKYQMMVRSFPSYIDEKSGEKVVLLPIEKLGLEAGYERPRGGLKYNVFAYKTEEGTIWGVTARIIRDFVRKTGTI